MSDSLLWLDDEPETVVRMANLIRSTVKREINVVSTVEAFFQALTESKYDMLIIDIGVPLTAGHDYKPEFLQFVTNEKYAGSAVLRYLSERLNEFNSPDIFVCSGHAPEFVDRVLDKAIAYQ